LPYWLSAALLSIELPDGPRLRPLLRTCRMPRIFTFPSIGRADARSNIKIHSTIQEKEETNSKKGVEVGNVTPKASQVPFWRVHLTSPPSQPCVAQKLVPRMVEFARVFDVSSKSGRRPKHDLTVVCQGDRQSVRRTVGFWSVLRVETLRVLRYRSVGRLPVKPRATSEEERRERR
jgi:hypothetical protein